MLYIKSLQELNQDQYKTGKVDKNKKTRVWGKVEGMWIPKTSEEKQEEKRASWLNDRKH